MSHGQTCGRMQSLACGVGQERIREREPRSCRARGRDSRVFDACLACRRYLAFPSLRYDDIPTKKEAADWWYNAGEKEAWLPHPDRGGWQAHRRAWAMVRKGHPVA